MSVYSLFYLYPRGKSSILTQNILIFYFIMTGKHFLLSFCFLNVIIRLFRTLFLNSIITGIRTDTMNNTTSDPVKIDLEQLLREGNIIRIKPQGYSMYPLFIPGRDEALIQQTDGTDCHRNDVVLYRRDQGILVLHRICRITSDGFYMVGDNQYEVEGPLRQDQIIGKLIAVNRKQQRIYL
mgnify:CR=1 FL=1